MQSKSLIAALDALSAALPMTLGSTVLLYTLVAPEYLGAGVLAALLGLATVHLFTARSQRPVFYGARFFESATVATMVLATAAVLPDYGIANSAATRLALLVAIGTLASLVVGALWAMKAQRFARFVPAPVYTGFANTVTVAILLSQLPALWRQAQGLEQPWLAWALALATLATALWLRSVRPKWPAPALGLVVGMGLAWVLEQQGLALDKVMVAGEWTLPLMQADFLSLALSPAALWQVTGLVVLNAVVIGTLMFLNTAVAGQMLTQVDDREHTDIADSRPQTLALLLASAVGAAPISGAPTPSLSAARHGPIEWQSLAALSVLTLVVLVSQVLVWMPLVTVSGVMLYDAWVMWDRTSVRQARRWFGGAELPRQTREDLVLIGSVMGASLLVNMMAGLLTGLVLGLLLHALRSTRQPVRNVWTGEQLASNCARSREEIQLLSAHGREIRIFQLDSQQFFASAAVLNRMVREHSQGAHYVVVDWSRVEHIDSSVAMTIGRLDAHLRRQGAVVWHAGADRHDDEVRSILLPHLNQPCWAADLDRALEQAENLLIQRFNPALPSSFEEPVEPPWLAGLPPPRRQQLARHLQERRFAAGEMLLVAGMPSDEMWLIVRGHCSVYLHHGTPEEVRIAGVSPGTTVGEMGFLDGSPRSATVVAESPVHALCMTRAAFRALSAEAPDTVQQILTQLTTDLSARLRFANRRRLSQ